MDGEQEQPNEPRRRGRPPKLTEERLAAIAGALMQGNFRGVAARCAGVSRSTLARWLRLGKEFPSGIYGQLARICPVAEAEFECQAVATINRVGHTEDPKLLCWLLERKYPQRWGKYRGELLEVKRRLAELEKLIAGTLPPE